VRVLTHARHCHLPLYSLVGVYRTAHHTEAEIEAWMKGLITKYQVQVPPNGRLRDTPGAITGFMASVNQAAIATVLEAPMSVLKKMIETLAEDEIDPKGMLRCKICLLVEEVPREFPVFVVRSHRMAVPDEFTPSGPDLLRPVYELYRAILNICRDSSLSGAHDDRRLQDLMDRFAATAFKTCSLSLEKIQAIMGSEDICTPVEWLSIFDAPLNFVLESEVVWPAEPWLQY